MTPKLTALVLLALLSLAGPLIEAGATGRVEPFSRFGLAEALLSLPLIYWWYHVDKQQRNYQAGPLMNAGVVALTILALPVYFIRSRGWKRGATAIALAALVLVITFALGELGEQIGAALQRATSGTLEREKHETIRLLTFVIVSAYFIYVSRKSLFRPRSHGFPRFFAWEFILALALLNAPHWTEDLFSFHQLVSWLFLLISIFLVVHGVRLLRVIGKPDQNRSGAELLAFERTSYLVTVGAYKYIRHPLYSSLLFLAWGVFLKHPSLPGLFLVLIASLCLLLTAKIDESECLQHFGDAYQTYMRGTKKFIPFLF
jgi:protein-S-isoprenylcysteine O-methyltransferase Ste14